MIVHHFYENIPNAAKGSVVAIGNFDGVHLGHRALIRAARDVADRLNVPLSVMTFEPHPRSFFQPQGEPFRLTLLPMKQRLFQDLSVDYLFVVPFDAAFAQLTGELFLQKVLKDSFAARHVVVGTGFSFGQGRSGTTETLKRAEAAGLFGVTLVEPAKCEGHDIYSSTRIRELIRKGDFDKATDLLNHPFEMEAEVVHGDHRGRTIGYPTANQNVLNYIRAPYGVYAVRVLIENEDKWREGVASFGIRPMFEVQSPLLETYIFDFNAEIYGKMMRVRPVRFLRPEMKFAGLDELKSRIDRDCLEARAVLKSVPL
jgi:riboflavin kinase/FMN adenylyltransferase